MSIRKTSLYPGRNLKRRTTSSRRSFPSSPARRRRSFSRPRTGSTTPKQRSKILALGDKHEQPGLIIEPGGGVIQFLFLSFVFGFDERAIKLFGMGLAVAIFVDATIVRMVLVPATMELLGDANWWLPRWLERILPKFSIEAHSTETLDLDALGVKEEPGLEKV